MAEMDIIRILRLLRETSFLIKVSFKKHQVEMIRWFAQFRIQERNDKYDDLTCDPEMMDEIGLLED